MVDPEGNGEAPPSPPPTESEPQGPKVDPGVSLPERALGPAEIRSIGAAARTVPLNAGEVSGKTQDEIATKLLAQLEKRDEGVSKLRSKFTTFLIVLIAVQFVLVSAVALVLAFKDKFDSTAFVAFVTAFFGQVIAIAIVVAKNLFPETSKDLAETLAAIIKPQDGR